ncbi:HepT-like ribonuclease domain-containing protein [Pelobium manganitolerans]|uniref:HepT-like ribonuclease domain-containing protein n=1 Tax=Pelobium manganitolerans TaxID=1842495 RepID=UPI003FA3BEF5
MSERDDVLLLVDISDSINKILLYTSSFTFEDYTNDPKTKDAVERNFEIIGEAVSRLSTDFKDNHPEVDWRILKDFRNFIIHEYFGIDNAIVWDIIENHIPNLKLKIETLF